MGEDSSLWRRTDCLEVESEANLSSFFDKAEKGKYEDGVWKFTFTVKKAGEK